MIYSNIVATPFLLSPSAESVYIYSSPHSKIMKMNLLMGDQTLFKDPEIFEINHVPEQFNFRDEQMRELAFSIRPAMNGCRPFNSMIRGLPGTGKTTSVRKLFSDIEEATRRILPIYINCKNDRTRFSVFATVFNRLFGHYPPTSGVAFRRIYNEIGNHLVETQVSVIICLDDANYLMYENHLNDALYSLLRIYEEFPGAKLGVIATVSNMDIDFMGKLDLAVSSVFQPVDIYFPPYGHDEILEILCQRVTQGLYPGVISDELLSLIVEKTVLAGDVRVGLELVKRSVVNAEQAARKEVIPEDVTHSLSSFGAKDVHLREAVAALSPEEKKLLQVIAEESRSNVGVLTSGILYKLAKEKFPIGYTIFYERLEKFDSMRIIDLRSVRAKGRTREIVLRYGADEVLGVL